MRLKEYIEQLESLLEAPYSQYVGAQGRPDADYVGYAYKRHPMPLGGKKYPYDRDRSKDTFQTGRDVHSGDREPMTAPFTAKSKGVTKKSGFEEASGLEQLVAWADSRSPKKGPKKEASGTPMNFTISGRGGAMLGNPAPGAEGGMGWATDPLRPDDDDEEFMDAMDTYGSSDAHTEAVVIPLKVPTEEPAVVAGDHWEDSNDPDLEKVIDRAATGAGSQQGPEIPDEDELTDFTSFPSVLMQVMGSGFGTGLGKTNPSGRGFMTGWNEDLDVLAVESAWAQLLSLLALQ